MWQAGISDSEGKPVTNRRQAEAIVRDLVSVMARVSDTVGDGIWGIDLTKDQVRQLIKDGHLELIGKIGRIDVELP